MCAPQSSPRRNKLGALQVIVFENICFSISGKATDIHRLYVHNMIAHGLVSKITCHMSIFFRALGLLPHMS